MAKKETKKREEHYEEKVKFDGTFEELIDLSLKTKMPAKRGKKKEKK